MFNASILAFSILGSVVSAPLVCSQDLSGYREFQFGVALPAVAKQALARAAIVEAVRLDQQEAPQRGIELRKKKDEESRAEQEKARRVNKAPFRP